ncbi:RNA/RNP complex-1-interacting phosphatase isoform X1 [Drosophila albomicans]|uniref:RNA/RNP complex-1-interacting phosphatase isoform X1 n=1 Tax=Drosophila albomicans TaxID=7291 RepID=A0A6P8Y3A2_DROAB|nr:RNA/RNP complex-1-interacting phosphatase isoform X1 [Drosophila albomicans]
MVKPIPDRWLDYQPIGQRIPSTRFIAFKVPLHQNINETVDEQQRLAPQSLLESVPNLGLIVDLTNTNRYYNPQAFTDYNVQHQKLMIPGHQTPPAALAKRFCHYVANFLEANADNDKLIGVHCTHGVNRTGYLICYFMITQMNMAPKLAIQTFADARGHKIERDNYTSSLLQLIAKEANQTNQNWPRQFQKTKDDQHDDNRSGSWRNDQRSWQKHLEHDRLHRQQREQNVQQRQQRRNQPQQTTRHQNQYQDRYFDRRQQEQPNQYQPSYRGNETRRYEPYNRKNSFNVSFNEKQTNRQTRPRLHWQRESNDHDYRSLGYRRHNNNYNDNNYSRNNNFRPYNNRQEHRPVHIRFNDDY